MVDIKDIVYPIFLECCSFCEDLFWENIFEKLAYGEAPTGSYINKGYICCTYKDREFNYKIVRKDPKVIYDELYHIFTTKLSILSMREKFKKKIEFQLLETQIKESRTNWFDIKRKNIKKLLIEQYIIHLKNKHSLSMKTTHHLLSLIMLSIIFKVITSKDIIYDNNKIVDIKGISIVDNNITFDKDIFEIIDDSSGQKATKNVRYLSEHWDKYLKKVI